MNRLTIAEAIQYAGYSRPTWLKWLGDKTVSGSKGNGAKDSWFIPDNEVERIRLEKLDNLNKEIKQYSETAIQGE